MADVARTPAYNAAAEPTIATLVGTASSDPTIDELINSAATAPSTVKVEGGKEPAPSTSGCGCKASVGADSTVIVGGVEFHVGGWADYEVERRTSSRHGVSGGDLYPGRSYVGAHEAVSSILSGRENVLTPATQKLCDGQIQLADIHMRRMKESALTISSVDLNELVDALWVGEFPDAAQISLVLLAAQDLAANVPSPELDALYAGAKTAGGTCYAELEKACPPGSIGARGVECTNAAGLRELESDCKMAAGATEVFAARTAAFAEAVADAIAQFES